MLYRPFALPFAVNIAGARKVVANDDIVSEPYPRLFWFVRGPQPTCSNSGILKLCVQSSRTAAAQSSSSSETRCWLCGIFHCPWQITPNDAYFLQWRPSKNCATSAKFGSTEGSLASKYAWVCTQGSSTRVFWVPQPVSSACTHNIR